MQVGAEAELVAVLVVHLLHPLLPPRSLQVPFLRGRGGHTKIYLIICVLLLFGSTPGQTPLLPAEGPGRPLERFSQAVIELVNVLHPGEGGEEEHEGEEGAEIPEGVPDGLRGYHDVDLLVQKVVVCSFKMNIDEN